MIFSKKIFLFMFMSLVFLHGASIGFSIDSGATNIANSSEFYIYASERIKSSHVDEKTLKSLISFQMVNEDSNSSSERGDVDFDIFVQDDNKSIKIKSKVLLASETKHFFSFSGSKILDIYSSPFNDVSIFFTSKKFSTITLSENNISIKRGLSKTIHITLDKFSGISIYRIKSSFPYLKISPNFIAFNRLNWDTPQVVTILAQEGNIYQQGTYDITFTESQSNLFKKLQVNLIDKIDGIFSKRAVYAFSNSANIQLKISKSPPSQAVDVELELFSPNLDIDISPEKIKFTYQDWDQYKTIKISVDANKIPQDFTSIKLEANKAFGVKQNDIFVNFVTPDVNSLTFGNIRIVDVGTLEAKIVWSLPEESAFNITYKVYASTNQINISNDSNDSSAFDAFLVKTSTGNRATLKLTPNQIHNISVVANYKVATKVADSNFTTNDKRLVYKKMQITTNKIIFQDLNANDILDDIEEVIKDIIVLADDSNNDNIPDKLQVYTASIFESNDFPQFDNYKDTDGDGMPDLLEVSIGRSPMKDDFNPPHKPIISLSSSVERIFMEKETSLLAVSKTRASDGQKDITNKLKVYPKGPCFVNGKLPYNIFTDKCKELVFKDLPEEISTQIHWVVFDDDFNVVHEPQTIKIFKGAKTIPYLMASFVRSITSSDDDVLFALSRYSKKTPENNVSIKLSVIPNVKNEKKLYTYNNDIFDFRVFKVDDKTVDIIIPQVREMERGDVVRVYKDGQWEDFNIKGGDKVFSSKGFNKKCNVGHQYYQEGIVDGTYCLKLIIKDGSSNDVDSINDGIFSFTGGVATKIEFIKFETKQSSGCSSLHARGFGGNERGQTKIDPLLPMILLFSFIYFIRIFTRKKR